MNTPQQLLVLLGICALTYFSGLEAFDPDLMESRNYIAAREIVESGDWWFPTMNGEPRLAKPPMPTWITAVFMHIGGTDNLFMIRLPGALMAVVLVLFQFLLLRALTKDRWIPFAGAAMLATSHLVLMLSGANTWDIHSQAWMLGSVAFFYRGWTRSGRVWMDFLWGGILFGFSVFSKGPVAMYAMFLPFVVAFGFTHGWKPIADRWREGLLAFLLILLVSVPWPLSVYLEMQSEAEEVAARETNSWGNRHKRPIYFYLHFGLYTGVWMLFALGALVWPWAKERMGELKRYRFLLIWTVLALVLLSVVPTKKERYLLPMIPPLMALATFLFVGIKKRFEERQEQRWDQIVLGSWVLLVALALLGGSAVILFFGSSFSLEIPLLPAIIYAVIFIGLAGALLYFWRSRKLQNLWWAMILVVGLGSALLFPYLPAAHYKNPDYVGLEALRENEKLKDLPIYCKGGANMINVWKAGKIIRATEFDEPELYNELPILLLTFQPLQAERIPEKFRDRIELEPVGDYDYFRKQSEIRAYATIIRKK